MRTHLYNLMGDIRNGREFTDEQAKDAISFVKDLETQIAADTRADAKLSNMELLSHRVETDWTNPTRAKVDSLAMLARLAGEHDRPDVVAALEASPVEKIRGALVATDDNGQSCAHLAAEKNHPDVLDIYVDSGHQAVRVALEKVDVGGRTPLDVAKAHGHRGATAALEGEKSGYLASESSGSGSSSASEYSGSGRGRKDGDVSSDSGSLDYRQVLSRSGSAAKDSAPKGPEPTSCLP